MKAYLNLKVLNIIINQFLIILRISMGPIDMLSRRKVDILTEIVLISISNSKKDNNTEEIKSEPT